MRSRVGRVFARFPRVSAILAALLAVSGTRGVLKAEMRGASAESEAMMSSCAPPSDGGYDSGGSSSSFSSSSFYSSFGGGGGGSFSSSSSWFLQYESNRVPAHLNGISPNRRPGR